MVVVILRYFSDIWRIGGWQPERLTRCPVNENVQKETTSLPPALRSELVTYLRMSPTIPKYGKGSAFTTFPRHGDGGVMSLRIGTRTETDKKMHTGHFYFAKNRTFLLCVDTAQGFSYNSTLLVVLNGS